MRTDARQIRRDIQKADKFIRQKKYRCLFPGCKEVAIRGHAIQLSACKEALAENGVVYTAEWSFNDMMTKNDAADPPDVVEISVNDASVFKGYCPHHDSRLLASAEVTNRSRNNAMGIALHLRALTLECCRKRQVADFCNKFAELTNIPDLRLLNQRIAGDYERSFQWFRHKYLESVFNLIFGSSVDAIEYAFIAFSRNLKVSCCGVFPETDSPDSTIAFNLISYADRSILVLTTFRVVQYFLNVFLARYDLPDDGERLANDIAFSKCQEPLIAPQLWRSLSEAEKLEVRLSLRPPNLRTRTKSPRIVKITPRDFVRNGAYLPEFLVQSFIRKSDAGSIIT